MSFLVVFLVLLTGGFTLIAWNPINDRLIEPYTSLVARASALTLNILGQGVRLDGTVIESPSFAVNLRNGCNGVEALIIFVSAVLAFPTDWRAKAWGLLVGAAAIQLINLIRVVALFLTGAYLPRFFASSHTVIWQTVVILVAVLLWIYWANRFAGRKTPAA